MGETTAIDWTDSTFNCWWGCTKIDPACDKCYAARDSKRYGFDLWGPGKPRRTFGEKHWNEPVKWNARAEKEGRRHRVFVASMADVFDIDGPEEERKRLFVLIANTPWLDWQILTKRPERMRDYLNALPGAPWPNIWAIVSAGNQTTLDKFAPFLMETNAVVRGISWEPALGPMDFTKYFSHCYAPESGLHWIVGGDESGSGGREAKEDWYRAVRDQCNEAGVAFFIKQFIRNGKKIHTPELDGKQWTEYPRPR
jgi:protein gp37